MDLHKITENALSLSEEGRILTMDEYDAIIKDSDGEDNPGIARMQRLANVPNKNF
jgi:hypothetical protein